MKKRGAHRWIALSGALPAGLALSCTTPVAVDLGESEANHVVTALERHGVAADKELEPGGDARWRVAVGRLDSSRAVTILSTENLPRDATTGLKDVFDDGSVVPSRAAEHAKLLLGTAGELERSLESVPGLLSARVHLAVARRDPLAGSGESIPASASVLLTYRGNAPPISEGDVRRLVSGAVQGLAPESVQVVGASSTPNASPVEALARFGPFTTSASALPKLRFLLGGAALLNIVLVGAVLALWSRQRNARAAAHSPHATVAPEPSVDR